MMVTMVATSAKPTQSFWIRSVNQLIAQATITAVKKKNVRRTFAKKLIAKPTSTAESNKSVNKVLSHVKMLSAVIINTALTRLVDHTDVMVERMSTNVRRLNVCLKTTVLLILFAKRTNVNHLNAVTHKTAKTNSPELAKNVNLEHVNVKRENALQKNAKNTLTVPNQATKKVVSVSKTNASSRFSTKSLIKWKEHVTLTNIVLPL